MRCARFLEKIFQARPIIVRYASLSEVFIAAWKNFPRRLSALLAARYVAFSERLSTLVSALSRNDLFTVHRKARLMFVMFAMDSHVCEGVFGMTKPSSTHLNRIAILTVTKILLEMEHQKCISKTYAASCT